MSSNYSFFVHYSKRNDDSQFKKMSAGPSEFPAVFVSIFDMLCRHGVITLSRMVHFEDHIRMKGHSSSATTTDLLVLIFKQSGLQHRDLKIVFTILRAVSLIQRGRGIRRRTFHKYTTGATVRCLLQTVYSC